MMKRGFWTSLTCILAMLLAAWGESCTGQQTVEGSAIRLASKAENSFEPRLASLIPAADLFEAPRKAPLEAPESTPASGQPPTKDQFWTLPEVSRDNALIKLPPVGEPPTLVAPLTNSATTEEEWDITQPIGTLLPPQPMEAWEDEESNVFDAAEIRTDSVTPGEIDTATSEKDLVAALIREGTAAATGVLTDQRVDQLAKKRIREAYAMANRGGYYAARQELIEVLRMVSHTQDVRQGVRDRTEALAQGLRALEEAEDFLPRGIQLEADLAIKVLCASHRTPIASQVDSQKVLPHQMMNGYFRYAQLKLAAAVAGEPAGSMALHALGKLAMHLGQVEPEKHRLSQRHAIAFQQAALLAHSDNHLAAHELATLLADAGHFAEAEKLLREVASRDPNAVVLRNLSLMQHKLGLSQHAIANNALADQMARSGASGTNNVQWVSPQHFSRTRPMAPSAATAVAQPAIRRPGNPPQRVPVAQPIWR